MTEATLPAVYVGIDWATRKHDVCVMRPDGRVLAERAFPAHAQGLAELAEWLASFSDAGPASIWVAIETPRGAIVDTLLERGFAVHSLNPKQLDRFRDRFTVAGAKDDRRDARVLADSLRTDRRAYRRLSVDDPTLIELREYVRMAEDLQDERNRLANRLREQLRRYFAQTLELTDDVTKLWFLDLLAEIPTPEHARRRRRSTVAKILKRHRVRLVTAQGVLEILRRPAVHVAPGTVQAATAHIRMLSERLRVVVRQHKDCHRRLDKLLAELSADGESEEGRAGEPRDAATMRTFPGIGTVVQATLLAGASRPLQERDYHALRALLGSAPVTRRSGKRRSVLMRQACDPRLRNAAYHWARVATQHDPHWKALYAALRARGHSHGRACRGVADRMLKVLVAMLRTGTPYDRTKLRSRAPTAAA